MKAAAVHRFPAFAWLTGLLVGLALLMQAGLVHAQPNDVDPPARAARVSEIIGDAWVYDAENREWVRVLRNQTLGESDRLRTDDRSRVGLRIGSTSLWVDERSDLTFNQLDEGRTLLQLDRGDIGLRLRAGGDAPADTRVRTREGEIVPERDGLYRVEQLDNDSGTRAYVWQGRLRFDPSRGDGDIPPTILQGGEQAEFWWAGGPRVERQRLSSDGFGDWIAAQREPDVIVAQRYVSPEMTGIEDLDRNGRWEPASDYGPLWIPTAVGPNWAPYRDGHWVWSRNWGWTWVDDAPWGFAPFHYGRWVMWGGRWCWAPGAYVRRPVYAPALVAWVGGGSFSVGVSVGGDRRPPPPRFGWYPLAPREAYVPPYRHSPVYVDRINAGGEHRRERDRGDRDDRRPPHSNLNVPGAVSFLPGQGGPVRALPREEAGKLRPMPVPVTAPGRQEFARVLPQRPPQEVRAPSQMPVWRGNERADRGDRNGRDDRRPDREQDIPRHDPRDRNVQAPPQPQERVGGPQGVAERNEQASQQWRQQQLQQQREQQERQQREQQQQQQQQQRAQQERQQQEQQQQQQRARMEQERQQREQQQQQQREQQQRAQQERQQQERQQQAERQQQERSQQERERAQQEQQQQQRDRAQQVEQQQRARVEQRQQEQQQRAQQQQQQQQAQQQQPQRREGPPNNGNGNRRGNDDNDRGDRGDRRGRQPQQQER